MAWMLQSQKPWIRMCLEIDREIETGVSKMRPKLPSCVLSGLACCLFLPTAALAGGHNLADYPLRVQIFQFNAHSHYDGPSRTLDVVDGEGRANLYENSQPRGFDFNYRCAERLRWSAGFETYPARWKKQNQSLEILLPQFGKVGAFSTCELRVEMKDTAYYRGNTGLSEEPAVKFKAWMDRHQYDPEHGKNEPVLLPPAPASAQAPPATETGATRPAGPQ